MPVGTMLAAPITIAPVAIRRIKARKRVRA
jgi:hypothetical protein